MPIQEVETPEQQPLAMIRVMQRRFSFQPPETMTSEIQEREKEVKLIILNVLSEVINDALKKSPLAEQDTIA